MSLIDSTPSQAASALSASKNARAAETSDRGGAEETRQRILAAARALYARRGSRGTTTREVAAEAHVNEATLFRHFGTKGQLLAAMLEHYTAPTPISEVLGGLGPSATLEDELRALGTSALDALRRKEDLIKIAMAEEVSHPESQVCVWRGPTATKQNLLRYFGQKVRGGELRGDPAWLARIFMSLFFSYVMGRSLWAEVADAPQERAVETMVGLFLNGARAD